MSIYRFVVRFTHFDPRSAGYLSDARALGFHNLQRIECQEFVLHRGSTVAGRIAAVDLKLLTGSCNPICFLDGTACASPPCPSLIRLFWKLPYVPARHRPGRPRKLSRAAGELGIKGIHRAGHRPALHSHIS